MIPPRHLRVRVLEALERRPKEFRSREELWPLRVPREPLPMQEILEQALPDDHRTFDVMSLRSRTLLNLAWEDGTTWDAWVIVLPSGFKLYCDTGADETRILASGGRNLGDDSDRAFLQLLAESAGRHFGIEISGDAPTRVRSSIQDRQFLIDIFVELFEVSGMEDSVRDQLAHAEISVSRDETVLGSDFRSDVERWMERVLGF
jgi:hypothetical protein